MQNKIGWIRLSGLIIGPILGSGIILLPAMVYRQAGDWALPAWGIMLLLGLFFAFLFSFLTVLFPGDAGVSNAIEYAFGKRVKVLSSIYLICAGMFGPVAVLLIAERYANFSGLDTTVFTCITMLICTVLLMMSITSIGRAALVLSTVVAVLLISGGLMTLASSSKFVSITQPFHFHVFGNALLLLFWGLVGWEVIGCYSGDIKDPKRTYTKAALFSAVIITAVSLIVAGAVQYGDYKALGSFTPDVVMILHPLAGRFSGYVFGVLALLLCVNTYLSFVGSISRLAANIAHEEFLPQFLNRRSKNNSPYAAVGVLTVIHFCQIMFVKIGIIDMSVLVSVANVFFLLNALIGILAAVVIFNKRWLKIAAGVLALCFAGILMFSSSLMLAIIALISYVFLLNYKMYPAINGQL